MDFFTANINSTANLPVDAFANAIARRFSAQNMIPRLPPPPSATTNTPSSSSPLPSSSSAAYTPVVPADLEAWLNDATTLILDIRPHAAFSSARIPGALSLSVPSTLLKRPLFSLQRLSAMLPSSSSRSRFAAWRSSKRILVYDADSHAIPDNSNISGLLRKFSNDGFDGHLAWLKGGFQGIWREQKHLIDTRPPTPDLDQEDDDDEALDHTHPPGQSVLRTRHLPVQAFALSSTLLHNQPSGNRRSSQQPKFPLHTSASSSAHHAVNPFFDTIRQNVELSHGITERIPLRLPHRVRRRIHDLPFPWLQRIAKRAGKVASQQPALHSSEDSPDDMPCPDQTVVDQGADTLAMQFYRIELAEQRRLMGIMEHHSKESGTVAANEQPAQLKAPAFPFSITAGVEKGAKNRYRHIWPFEHARVKLRQKDDDYVNASYVQPLGTNKRYIATQGPLPATFVDFWTLCWEQNVHVIVMLTREVEGAMVKCGSYWTDHEFGPLRLRLVSTTGVVDASEEPSGFFSAHSSFAARSSRPPLYTEGNPSMASGDHKCDHYHKSETIKRVFELTHTGYPEAKPRKIIHLQYLEWPDMNVPDDPRGVLGLIKQVEEAVVETGVRDERTPTQSSTALSSCNSDIHEKTGISQSAMGKNSPVLLHCSAGVGRTGGFIAVDAILDAIRREVRMQLTHHQVEKNAGQVDSTTQKPSDAFSPLRPKQLEEQTLSSGHVVHLPVAQDCSSSVDMDMQVDDSDGPLPTEVSELDVVSMDISRDTSFAPPFQDTKKWAEDVQTANNYGENRQQPRAHTTPQLMVTPMSSLESGASAVSSSEDSSLGHRTAFTGSTGNDVQPSSSLGTSISSWSSPVVVDRPGQNLLFPMKKKRDAVMTEDLRGARERTTSAPPSAAASMLKRRAAGVPSSLALNLASVQGNVTASSSTPVLSLSNVGEGSLGSSTTAGASATALVDGVLRTAKDGNASAEPPSASSLESTSPFRTFDYKDPRPLHDDKTPPTLDSFEDPILEVVQDMREQRMSLCQSLRQYVFVHGAILEGALMVLDEERELAAGQGDDARKSFLTFASGSTGSRRRKGNERGVPKTAPGLLPSQRSQSGSKSRSSSVSSSPRMLPSTSRSQSKRTSGASVAGSSSSRQASPCPVRYPPPAGVLPPLALQLSLSNESVGSVASSAASTGDKRSASPTELLKEGKEGEVLLSKRPSMKRFQKGTGMREVEGTFDGRTGVAPVPPLMSHRPSSRAMPP